MTEEQIEYDILHVDDDPGFANLVKTVFEKADTFSYNLDTVNSVQDFYESFRNNDYDVVITDLNIHNGEEGLTLANNVQDEQDIPVVMYTLKEDMEEVFLESAPDEPRGFHSKKDDYVLGLVEEAERLLGYDG